MRAPTFLLAAALALAAGAGDALAARFILNDGEVVEGRVVHGTRNTLTVLTEAGTVRQIPISRVARLEAKGPGDRTVSGRLGAVQGTRVEIRTGEQQAVWLEGDRVLLPDRGPEQAERALARVKEPAPAPEQTGAAPPAAGAELDQATAPKDVLAEEARPEVEPAASRSLRALVPQALAAPAEQEPPAADPDGPPLVRIEVSAEEIGEAEGAVSFEIELSKAAAEPIRLVYSTVDGAAASGDDYEAQQGVINLPPGKTSYRIETPLTDDGQREDPEQFFLFVTADPKQATVEDKWRTVTIVDDD